MLPWLLRHRRGGLATGRLGTHLWRAGIGLIAMLTWFSAIAYLPLAEAVALNRSEEHTSELQSLMRISYAVFCLKKKNTSTNNTYHRPCLNYISYILIITVLLKLISTNRQHINTISNVT